MKSFTKPALILLFFLSLSLGACSVIHPIVAYRTAGIGQQDLEDLRTGRLLAVRDRYEERQTNLNDRELALLCDIYVKHVSISEAHACLDKLEQRSGGANITDSINGKRALIDYLLGEYEQAADRSKEITSDGGRYVYALSRVQLGDNQPAIDAAAKWALSYQPPQVFLAANLFLATKQYDKVLETLQDAERRLDRDYNLSGGTDVFGYQIDPAPLRVDLFGEFGFGLLDTFSYAPRSNVYVEYTLAKAELETGRIDKARKRYDTILGYAWIGAYRDVQWRALSDRARVSELDGETDRAIKLYKESVEVIESARASITTDAGRIGFVGDKQEVYGHLVRLLLDRGDTVAAFEYSERARSRALVDLLASVREFGAQSVSQRKNNTALTRSADRAETELSEDQELVAPEQIEGRTRYVKEQIEGRTRYVRDEYRRVSNRSTVGVYVQVTKTELAKLQPLLQANEGLLSYFHDNSAWTLFLVTRDSEPLNVELEAEDLDQKVSDFRSKLLNKGDYKILAKELYVQLIQTVEQKLPEKRLPEKLTIVPHGALHYLPFAALMPSDDEYLIQRYTLSVLPSADLRGFIIPEPISSRILAIGNPFREGKADLLGAEREAVMVAKKARPASTPLLRKGATKTAFLGRARGHGIIHIASHGIFRPEAPLESSLLLAPDEPNGNLTVTDLFGVGPQWGAQIAVLRNVSTTLRHQLRGV